MQTKKRIGHSLIAGGVFVWLSLSVAVNFLPTTVRAMSMNDIFSLSNQERSANNVTPLALNERLIQSAEQKAKHMLNNGYFAHTAPDGTTGWDFVLDNGYSYASIAENLASSNQSATSVVDGWMKSPGHRSNLLSDTYNEVGYGSVYVGDWEYEGETFTNTYFIVALYGLNDSGDPVIAPTVDVEESDNQAAVTQVESVNKTQETKAIPTGSTQPLRDPSQAGTTSRLFNENTSGEIPVASLAPTEEPLINGQLALVLATVALAVILTGVVLEIRWIKHHAATIHPHLPHLHHN